MRYVMVKQDERLLVIKDQTGNEHALASQNRTTGRWMLSAQRPDVMYASTLVSGPSLAGLLIDAGFEGIVDFE